MITSTTKENSYNQQDSGMDHEVRLQPALIGEGIDESESDNNTSRTDNTKSQHHSVNKTINSKQSDSDAINDQSNVSSSHFEINCSPLPASRIGSSYYAETRARRNSHTIEQENEQSTQTAGDTSNQTQNFSLQPLKTEKTVENTQPNIVPSDEKKNDVIDDASCCTLLDSGMSLTSGSNTAISIDGDNTIATSKQDTNSSSTNTDSQTLQNSSFREERTVSSVNTTRSVGSSVSASRGEEHITSRMKKYGLFNLHEMKRKQQHRRTNRNKTATPGNTTNSSSPPTTSNSASVHQPATVLSGLTEVMTVNSGPGTANNIANNSRFQKNESASQEDQNKIESSSNETVDVPTRIRTAPLHVQMAVEEIHRWLFTEGGHFEDVQTLMTQYSLYVREHFGIPLDRLFYGGVGLHPKLTAYLWKWEAHGEFTHSEMPPHIFARRNEIFSPDEPFCVLEQGRAEHVRIRDTDDYIPPDTAKWFRGCNYKDYFALPDIHRGISKGGLAWSTKSADGFCEDDIQFFRMTHAALTTIMRLHTNDLVLNTLTDRMEAEIEDRTNELAIANAKLEAANDEISKHASKQLEHFACMSHEIRTPLNCIVGLSSLLLENEDLADNDDLMETIHMVYNSADLVQGVVNDVLDYAKIESGHFELDVKPNDLQTTLNSVVHSISNKLVDKNVEVRTSYSGLLGKRMTTDGRRLQQILYNILGNAAKFSREGTTIDFKVQVVLVVSKSTAASKPMIRFSIKDYGKGIEEKNFEKIFQPFSQASKETQTVYGGTGLGLSITKNLVERLGGKISIKSQIDKFTEFIVDLPYEEEQLVDVSQFREKLSDTSIVILDANENSQHSKNMNQSAQDDNEKFLPFPKIVCQQFGLNVIRCSSWDELESKLGLRANIKQKYFFLAHEDIEERQGILNVEKLVNRERCTWFTFGSEGMGGGGPNRKYHFKTLTGIFPSTLLSSMLELATIQREAIAGGSSSDTSSFSSLELESKSTGSIGSMNDELAEELPIPLQEGQEPSGEKIGQKPSPSNSSGSTKSKKKFVTKYPSRNLKVLVVDDNLINQKVLHRILKRLGVTEISIVDNGKKAVDITESTRFDCIFMDMEMPVMGGLEACKLIVDRDKEAARVAFVTAHDIEDIREKADAVGAFGYISKPLKLQDIHEFLTDLEDLKKRDESKISPSGPFVENNTSSSNSVPKKRPTATKKKTKVTKQYPPRNIKVLVAEDNVINQKVLERILKRVGVTDITIVDNGEKAVAASAETRFDCIFMDMQMPIMDGVEACRIIVKRDEGKEDPPKIIFVTAHALVEFREKALGAGAFDFITKPFKMEDIDNVLKLVDRPKTTSTVKNEANGGKGSEEVAKDPSSTSEMCTSSTSSDESGASNNNAKPTKMPKLVAA